MREIKFQGKTLDGRWIHGDLWQRPYAKDCITIVSFMEDAGTTGGLEVIPETVGQYTGLKDKNGKEIYEGDIVYLPQHNHSGRVFLNVNHGWVVEGICMNVKVHNYKNIEVIGNIHENPELLKEESEVKKDIEWAIKEIQGLETETSENYPHEKMIEKEIVLGILNQLDEPEVNSQIDKLANFIMSEVEGEPSQSQGAVDTAIRIIKSYQNQERNIEKWNWRMMKPKDTKRAIDQLIGNIYENPELYKERENGSEGTEDV